MKEKQEIIFFADNLLFPEDTPPDKKEEFKYFVDTQLYDRFPHHKIEVAERIATDIFWTDDEENRAEISDFCHNLWNEFCSLK